MDADPFFDSIEKGDRTLFHAHHKFRLCTSITVIGEFFLIIQEREDFTDLLLKLSDFFRGSQIQILVPNDEVAILCYEFSKDLMDGRMIGQKTERTHLAYAMAYQADFFLSYDTALARYRIPQVLIDSGYTKPDVIDLGTFKGMLSL